jgi:hypothetical protein
MNPEQVAQSQCIDAECHMSREHESKWNLKELTSAEIRAAIRYLDPDAEDGDEQHDAPIFALGITLLLMLGYMGITWLYQRIE